MTHAEIPSLPQPPERGVMAPLPKGSLATALVGIVGGIVLSAAAVIPLVLAGIESDVALVVASQLGLWAGLLWAVRRVSRLHLSGHPFSDFGLTFEWRDAYRGLAVWILTFVAVASVALLLPERTSNPLDELVRDRWLLVVGSFLAVVITPVVEELYFRGLVMRGLVGRLGHNGALVAQAVVFGCAHVTFTDAATNVATFAVTGALGLGLGFAVVRFGRLGPSVVAHCIQNGLAVTVTAVGAGVLSPA